MEYHQKMSLSAVDRAILDAYCKIADAVAALVGPHCEVVVHSLEDYDHSLIKVVNGSLSGREVGAPLTNVALSILNGTTDYPADVVGPYVSMSTRGQQIRSITSLIRGEGHRLIGMICFNMNLSQPFYEIARTYLGQNAAPDTGIREIYPESVDVLIDHMLNEAIAYAQEQPGLSAVEKNQLAIGRMIQSGLFDFKGAVDIAASKLGVSRATVYNYLRDARQNRPANTAVS